MTEASRTALPIGGYSARQLSADELAQWSREAEARRQQIRVSSLKAIGLDADGRPFLAGDAHEEERLAITDLRAPLR
jgi:hypothetical protein